MVEYEKATIMNYADHDHLLHHAQGLFPNATIVVIHSDNEVIHIDANGHRFTFEITSDDEDYVFTDGRTSFRIPLMENPDAF